MSVYAEVDELTIFLALHMEKIKMPLRKKEEYRVVTNVIFVSLLYEIGRYKFKVC